MLNFHMSVATRSPRKRDGSPHSSVGGRGAVNPTASIQKPLGIGTNKSFNLESCSSRSSLSAKITTFYIPLPASILSSPSSSPSSSSLLSPLPSLPSPLHSSPPPSSPPSPPSLLPSHPRRYVSLISSPLSSSNPLLSTLLLSSPLLSSISPLFPPRSPSQSHFFASSSSFSLTVTREHWHVSLLLILLLSMLGFEVWHQGDQQHQRRHQQQQQQIRQHQQALSNVKHTIKPTFASCGHTYARRQLPTKRISKQFCCIIIALSMSLTQS